GVFASPRLEIVPNETAGGHFAAAGNGQFSSPFGYGAPRPCYARSNCDTLIYSLPGGGLAVTSVAKSVNPQISALRKYLNSFALRRPLSCSSLKLATDFVIGSLERENRPGEAGVLGQLGLCPVYAFPFQSPRSATARAHANERKENHAKTDWIVCGCVIDLRFDDIRGHAAGPRGSGHRAR